MRAPTSAADKPVSFRSQNAKDQIERGLIEPLRQRIGRPARSAAQ
jgi:hypothetical protein